MLILRTFLTIDEMKKRFLHNQPPIDVIDKFYNFLFDNVIKLKELGELNPKIKMPCQEEIASVKLCLQQNSIKKADYLKELV